MRKYKKIERKTLKDDFSKTYGNKKRSRINLGGNILMAPVLSVYKYQVRLCMYDRGVKPGHMDSLFF